MEPKILDEKRLVNQPTIEEYSEVLFSTQRLAGIGTLAASLAHELTNPLSIITAACSNLESMIALDDSSADDLRSQITMIEQSAWRCVHLVQTLRHYSHLEGPDPVECDMNLIIEDSLTLVSYQFERERSVKICTDLAKDLAPISCDRNQITQVMINLLTNARDALPAVGGRISIKSWLADDGYYNVFSVSDNGTGIDAAIEDRIFEPFFTTKSPQEGSGLGLAIAAQIIEQHQGKIAAANNPDKGATFTVYLPV